MTLYISPIPPPYFSTSTMRHSGQMMFLTYFGVCQWILVFLDYQWSFHLPSPYVVFLCCWRIVLTNPWTPGGNLDPPEPPREDVAATHKSLLSLKPLPTNGLNGRRSRSAILIRERNGFQPEPQSEFQETNSENNLKIFIQPPTPQPLTFEVMGVFDLYPRRTANSYHSSENLNNSSFNTSLNTSSSSRGEEGEEEKEGEDGSNCHAQLGYCREDSGESVHSADSDGRLAMCHGDDVMPAGSHTSDELTLDNIFEVSDA